MGSPSASPTGATGATGATGGATGTTGPVPTAPVGAGGTVVGTGGSTSGAGGTSSVGGNPSMGGSSGAGTGGSTGGSAGVGAAGAPVLGPDVTVQLGMTKQEMVGFGINNNWSPALSDSDADRLFGTGEGQLGLTVLRIGMGPNGTPYNGNDCWSDITKATERGAEYIIGTLWTPPANMKSNNSISGGGHLLPEYYEEWSDTIAAFPAMVKDNTGVDLYAMSPQNETDFASCGTSEPCNGNYDTTIYTGQEYADFAAIVGPKLHALNPPVKLMSPEASEWLHLWSNESACCSEPGGKESSDPLDCGFPATNCTDYNGYDYGHALFSNAAAWEQVDIIGTHQYDTQVAEPWPDDVPDKKPLWQTEMSGVKWWPEQGPSTDIQNGVAVAGWIHSALTVGDASAWLWWWYKAMGATNEGLLLSDGTVAKRMWTLGNYSRFIRPGYMRVDVTGDVPENALLTAFSAPDGTVVVVAVNKGSDALEVPITIAGGTAPAEMSTWVTSATEDLAASDAVTVTGGIFMASLPGTTVTTFVGK
jgi:glucuronoarabinoxylan endo-1,4-beta-xylanase